MPQTNLSSLEPMVQQRVKTWLNGPFDEDTKEQIRDLLQNDPLKLNDAFYADLSFGTGGLRGIMGVGSNRMNVYTVRRTTQGLANYLLQFPPLHDRHSVFISYDSRHHSLEFAFESARVLAASGIEVFITREMRPTPFTSFGCRIKKCSAGIMITASHNPPEYNGYKVYWTDGGQVVAPHDEGILKEIEKIQDFASIKQTDKHHPMIRLVDEELDQEYLDAIYALRLHPADDDIDGSALKISYTSLHGTGIVLVPDALKDWGFVNLNFVEKQIIPDGDFPTAKSPNPEYPEALKLGIDQLKKTGSDLLIATDPDADRMGIVVLHQEQPVILTGNEIAAICIYHLCCTLTQEKTMPAKGAFVTTIVSSDLLKAIATYFHKPCFEVLTGFKYIAELIHRWEDDPAGYQFIFGAEESYGYLFGTIVRDKDAIISACLIAEIALQCKMREQTLVDLLHDIYRQFGLYKEKQLSLGFEGEAGLQKISELMDHLRKHPLQSIAGKQVMSIEDYETGLKQYTSGQTEKLTLPRSNVLLYRLHDGSKLVIRPSGTEPKVKFYAGVHLKDFSSIENGLKQCEQQLTSLLAAAKTLYG